jgi:hypothetical protein
MESSALNASSRLESLSPERLEELWQQSKQIEK